MTSDCKSEDTGSSPVLASREEQALPEQDSRDEVVILDADVFQDIPETLKLLDEMKERVSERLSGVKVDEARELLKNYHIKEPLREGIDHLDGVLGELLSVLSKTEGRMHMVSSWLEEDPPKATRQELFELQLTAATLMMKTEEERDHRAAVLARLGEQPSATEVDRATAAVEMFDKLNDQLVEVARLKSWFTRRLPQEEEETVSAG
jgi:hypothetical protein